MGCSASVEDCERLAERKGWEVVERYVDDDVSAWSGSGGRSTPVASTICAAGVIDGLLVYDLDRLHRQPTRVGGVHRPVPDGCG